MQTPKKHCHISQIKGGRKVSPNSFHHKDNHLPNVKKIAIASAATIALVAVASSVRAAVKVNRDLVIKTSPKVKFNNNGLELIANVALVNPTNNSITISKPFVRFQQGTSESEEPIGFSSPDGKKIKVAPNASTPFRVSINISWIDLATKGTSILASAAQTGKLTFHILPIFNVKIAGQNLRIAEPEKFSFTIPQGALKILRLLWKPNQNAN